MIRTRTTALALAAGAFLAACGGGDTADGKSSFADGSGQRARALASTPAISNDQLFRWAQLQYPELFGSAPPSVIRDFPFEGRVFDVRDYHNGNYLGVSNGRAYGYGEFTGHQLTDFGAMQDYAAEVCARVGCSSTGGGTGRLNGCMEGASTALQTGKRYDTTYVSSVLAPVASSGEYRVETEVLGNAAFEGQSAIKVRNRTRGSQFGVNVDAEVFVYAQIADGDLTRTLGSEVTSAIDTYAMTTRTVFNPPSLNTEFTLAQGASLTKTETATSTMSMPGLPVAMPPTTSTTTTSHTFEAIETITVRGRSFETCRYRSRDDGDSESVVSWHIKGLGIPARMESKDAAGTVVYRAELKSATVNGSSI